MSNKPVSRRVVLTATCATAAAVGCIIGSAPAYSAPSETDIGRLHSLWLRQNSEQEKFFLATKDKKIKKIIFQSPFFSTKDWEKDANRLINALPAKTKKVIKYCHEVEATDSKVCHRL